MKQFSDNILWLRPLYRGLPVVLVAMMAGIIIAGKYLSYATPMYESTAKIKLADLHEGVPNSNLFKDLDVFVNTNKISAEVELIKSRVLVRKMLQRLPLAISVYRVGELHKTELYQQSPFYVQAVLENTRWYDKPFQVTLAGDSLAVIQTPAGDKLKTHLNNIVSVAGGTFSLVRNNALLQQRPDLNINDKYEFIVHSAVKLENDVMGALDVMAVDKDVPVIRISYKSPVPQKSADVVNALSAAYITDYIEEKFKSADTTAQFLNRQLDTFSHKLSASEGAIESYRDNKNIINIRQETETDLRKIADLKKQLASVSMNLKAIDSLNNYMSQGRERFFELAPNFEAFTDLLSTELVKKIKELQREKKDLLVKYTPENEKVKVVDDKLADISSYLQESIRNTEKSLHIQYNNLEHSISESEKVFIGLPTKEKNMTILERNFSLNEDIYRFLHSKRTEAEIARAATISFHRVISEGEVPEKPVSPNAVIIKIMAGILGILAGIALIYTVHAVKAKVNDASTIHRLSGTPLLAAVPFLRKAIARQQYFRKWALEMELKQMLAPGTVICLSSFYAGEGKSFITAGLHQAITTLNKRVIMVTAEEVVAMAGENPADWRQYLQQLQADYEIVLIQNFEINKKSAALVPMAVAAINLFILDSRRTPRGAVTQADELAVDLQLPAMHFVLNRAGYTPSLLAQVSGFITQLTWKKRCGRYS